MSSSPVHPQVLLSLRLLLMMKPHVLSRVSREVSFGLHELLKTNAANIHCTDDWYTLFSLLECMGAGVKPPASFQIASTTADSDTGSVFLSQSDTTLLLHLHRTSHSHPPTVFERASKSLLDASPKMFQ